MAGAPKGNKNAEKWNEETVLAMLENIAEYLRENPAVYTLTSALIEFSLYPQWWSEMAEKFKDNNIVSETIKRAESTIESRIVNDTMVGDAKSAAFSIFLLKNKFGYVDKQEQDFTSKGESLNVINLGQGVKPDETTT